MNTTRINRNREDLRVLDFIQRRWWQTGLPTTYREISAATDAQSFSMVFVRVARLQVAGLVAPTPPSIGRAIRPGSFGTAIVRGRECPCFPFPDLP